MSKISTWSSKLLALLSATVVMGVFVTLSMSFTPVEDDYMTPPDHISDDSIFIAGIGTRPKKSHYTTSGCGTTYNNKTDYFRTIAETRGNGSVYVSTSNASKTGASSNPAESATTAGSQSYVNWDSGTMDGQQQDATLAAAHTKTLYMWATPSEGFYLRGWSSNQTTYTEVSKSNPYAYTHSLTGEGFSSYKSSEVTTYQDANSPHKATQYAFFSPVTVEAVSPASSTINPVNALNTCDAYTGTISFETTGADAMNDFTNNTVSLSKTGNGTFTITSGPTISGSTVSLNYKFTGNGTYGSRNNQATFTLTSKGTGASAKSATVTANFPSVGLSGSDVEVNTTTVSAATTASFTVNTTYVDGTGDFTSIPSTFSNISGPSGTWTLNSCTFNGTDFATGAGSFTVNYTFTPNGTEGTTTAEFTLTAKAAVGGTTKTITLTALVEKPSVQEASVTIGGTTTKYDYLADALVVANGAASVPTVKLLKDVTISSTQTLSRTMTFDLNSFTLNANLSSSATKALSITQGAQVTFVSSRAGGKLIAAGNYAGRLSAVEVTKGSFLLQSGDITLTNSNTGTTAAQMYACGVYLGMSAYVGGRPTSMMQMSGGSITVNRPSGGAYAYGVYCDGTGTNSAAADLRNAAITTTVTGGSYAYGAYIAGSSPITNMTISANAKDYTCAIYVKADATTVIDAGSYSATTTATNARALHSLGTARVNGNPTLTATATTSNAIVVDQAGGTITLSNGTFTASTASTAYGLHQSAANATATIASGTFNATATTTTAIGAYLQQSGNSLTTTGGTFTASSKTSAYGVKADNTNSTIIAQNTTFKGVSDISGATNAFGGRTVGTATFTDCEFEGNTKSAAYGLVIGNGTTTITGGSFSAISEGATAVGLYPKDNAAAKMNISGTEITATGTTGVAGVKVASGEITLENTTISATGTSAARSVEIAAAANATITNSSFNTEGGVGVYNYGTLDISTTTVTSSTYALYLNASKATKVSSGHFKGTTSALGTTGTIGANNNQFTGGFYNTNSGLAARCASGYQVFTLPSGNSEQMAGYLYSIGTPDAPGYSVCKNIQRNKEYLTLSEALQEVTSGQTIVMTSDYTLPAGNYTLPAGATLLVPYKADQTAAIGDGSKTNCTSSYTSPSAFRTLTFADGVNFVVKGIFELSALIHADGQWACEGSTTGKYGKLHMSEGAKIELDGKLYSWGYITGTGVIEAKNGSSILEPFQMADWPGGSNALSMRNHNAFMITHYFYQNIECNIYYRPGSNALGTSAAIMSGTTYYVQNVKLVGQTGDNAMFLMDKNDTNPDSWVHRKYNPSTDINTWTVNSGANLGGITVTVSSINLNSANYDLPITSNMAIVLNYGDMQITQNVNFLPGSKLEIHKEGRVFIKGVKVGFFNFSDYKGRYYGARYSPTWGTTNPRGSLSNAILTLKEAYKKDAEMFVHGIFDIMPNGNTKGSLYTSPTGSNIHSTNEDAGMILYSSAAPAAGSIYYVGGSSYNNGNQTASVVAAKLQNGDASYSDTDGTTAGQLWGYKNDRWIKMRGGDCLYEELDGSGNPTGVVNAYPSSFVEVEPNDPDDHAYHAVADISHYVINTEASTTSSNPICTWWDAVPKEEGHYMISNPKSDLDGAYYYYDETASYWKPRNYRINWYNNTSLVIYNNVARNAKPKFTGRGYNSSNALVNGQTITVPTETGYNFYWDGWVTDNADRVNQDCRVLDNEDMPRATGVTTYYAHFKKEIKKYTITFLAEDGKTTIEQLTVNHGEIPVCSAPPTKLPTTENVYTLVWSPALSAATKEQKYTATFTPAPRPYTITFVNYNGDVLKQEEVTYGSRPTAPTNPTRQNDGFYSYDFTGWQTGETFVAAGGTLPTVTGVTTYTAQFSTTDWTPEYTIEFQDEDGTSLQTQHIRLGNTLTDPSATLLASGKLQKAEDAGHTYVFDSWSPTLKTTPDADAIYTATYRAATTKQYTITFKDEDGFVLQSGNVNYGTTPTFGGSTPTKDQDEEWVYTFGGWTPAVTDVTGEQIYTATYNKTKRKYNIVFKNGTTTLDSKDVEYGVTPTYTGSVPTKNPDATYYYAFDGWTPVLSPVTSDMTYYAHFSQTTQTYSITWKSEDGSSTYRTDPSIPAGSTPTYGTSGLPTKIANAQYTYTFDGWSTSAGGELVSPLPALTGNATFFAHFAATVNTYTVTWKNHNGIVLETDENVPYGTTPTYDGETPTKDADASYVYTYNSWTPAIGGVTGNTIYTATFSSVATEASVTAGGETKYFANIKDAFADAGNKRDATIKVLKSISRDNTVADAGEYLTYTTSLANNTCILDLNNFTIDIRALNPKENETLNINQAALTINSSNVTFTITDNSVAKGGKLINGRTGRARYTVLAVKAGNVILDNGTISITNTGTAAEVTTNVACAVRLDGGSFTINNGTVTASATHNPYAIWVRSGATLTINGGTVNSIVNKSPYYNAYGVYVDGGTATLVSGTVNATANLTNSYGAYGIYVNTGTASVVGGVVNATSKTTNAYGMYLTSNGAGSITAGNFKSTGTSNTGGINADALEGRLNITGGFYNVENNLAAYTQLPYNVFALTSGPEYTAGYRYEVAEACVVTWYTAGGTCATPTTIVRPGSAVGTLPIPTKEYYSFDGWFTEETGGTQISASQVVSANTTYYAHWSELDLGAYLDIVDWETNGSGDITAVVVNMNNYVPATKKAQWKVAANGKEYTKTNWNTTDHTLSIDLSGLGLNAGDKVPVAVHGVKDATDNLDSYHFYTVPMIVNNNTTLTGTDAESIVYVRKGTLTVNANATVGEIYVAPGAELLIESSKKLTVTKLLVMRTEAFTPSILTNNGTLTIADGAQMYYSRRVADNSQYFQLGLPFDVTLGNAKLSLFNDKPAVLGTHFGIETYNAASRAQYGKQDVNWVNQTSLTKLSANTGYQLLSSSPYYYEIYFPVTYSKEIESNNPMVSVSVYTPNNGNAADQGWNYICSPFTHVYTTGLTPSGMKISELMENNKDFYQYIPDRLYPAQPFYYQATAAGSLKFGTTLQKQMRRRAPESEIGGTATAEIEWLRLHYGLSDNNKGVTPTRTRMEGFAVEDQTNIFLHPSLFSNSYNDEYEAAKWSTTGSRPFIYTSLAYGNLAFAALPDTTELIPLTVFNPTDGEMRFALADNDFMNRLDELWLIDTATGEQTNLLYTDYTYYAFEAGTERGRFFLRPVIRNTDMATDIVNNGGADANGGNDRLMPRKIMIDGYLYILMPDGKVYDAVGRKLK